ncbi:hypothetical protein QOZ83_16285 [Romboutsia sedimentorum]|uniref:hypothetical protein n=1 Tax=Romboutsia sedimentorum TaxID=1368474 RepID=UPI0024DE8D54|nr:hypothetical protein [Romboutsia sedimentorum]MDK2587403.1 hypothetical protein [Romboutsia sedimentorum]
MDNDICTCDNNDELCNNCGFTTICQIGPTGYTGDTGYTGYTGLTGFIQYAAYSSTTTNGECR